MVDKEKLFDEFFEVIKFTYKYVTLYETGFECDPTDEEIMKIYFKFIDERLKAKFND